MVRFIDSEEMPKELIYLVSARAEALCSYTLSDIEVLLLVTAREFYIFFSDEESQSKLILALRRLASAPETGLTGSNHDTLWKRIDELERKMQAEWFPPIY